LLVFREDLAINVVLNTRNGVKSVVNIGSGQIVEHLETNWETELAWPKSITTLHDGESLVDNRTIVCNSNHASVFAASSLFSPINKLPTLEENINSDWWTFGVNIKTECSCALFALEEV
jgi:hypothetical protein